jgi:hypothetical protein
MNVPAATGNAEVGEAKAQSVSYVVLLAATTAISGFLFGFDTAVINGVLLLSAANLRFRTCRVRSRQARSW